MAANRVQSALASKLGDRGRKAAEAHKNDTTDFGNMELPSGIEGGVAQLVDCKFTEIKQGKTNAGQLMFYAAGVVVQPKVHNGIPVEGLRTQISEPLFDTPGRSRETLEDHVAWVQNEMRKLGASADSLDLDNIEATAAALKEFQPHFRFRTWKGQPQTTGPYKGQEPRVNHQWGGQCEYSGGSGDGGVEYTPPTTPSQPNGQTAEPFNEFDNPGDTSSSTEGPDSEGSVPTLLELSEAADQGDESACEALRRLGNEAGIPASSIDDAASWTVVAELIQAASGPEIGSAVSYHPLVRNPRTKKEEPSKKAVDCSVVAVDKKTRTCTLKTEDGVEYKGVMWENLG